MNLDTYTHINKSTNGKVYERYIHYFENGKIVKKETYIGTNFSSTSHYHYDDNNLIDYIDHPYYDYNQDYTFENGNLKELIEFYNPSPNSYTQGIYNKSSDNSTLTHKLYDGFDNSLSLEDEIIFNSNSTINKIIRNSYNEIHNNSYTATFEFNNSLLHTIHYLYKDGSIELGTFNNLELNADNFYDFYNKSLYGNNTVIFEYTNSFFEFFSIFGLDYKSGTCYVNGEPLFEIQTEFDSKNRMVKRTYYSIDRENSEDVIEEFTYKN